MTARTDGRKVRVLVVEDATSQQVQLVEVLRAEGDIVVVGQPTTTAIAIELVAQARNRSWLTPRRRS